MKYKSSMKMTPSMALLSNFPYPTISIATEFYKPLISTKDVDGFHPINIGRMTLNLPSYLPATPMGIVTLLERNNIETSGKHCVVVGRSNIVGRPMSILMSRSAKVGNCTVTLCHSRTQDLEQHTKLRIFSLSP